jgi:hypothetical protein
MVLAKIPFGFSREKKCEKFFSKSKIHCSEKDEIIISKLFFSKNIFQT